MLLLLYSHIGYRGNPVGHNDIKTTISIWLAEGKDYEVFRMGSCVWWAIWLARDEMIFQGKNLNIHKIIREAQYWFKLSQQPVEDVYMDSEVMQRSEDVPRWMPPPSDRLKINVDAAFSNGAGACAAVARNFERSFKGGSTIGHLSSPLEAETRVVKLGVELGIKMNQSRFITESDSQTIVRIPNNETSSIPWRLRPDSCSIFH